MIIDFHFENSGITLYINHNLQLDSAKEQLYFVLSSSELEMTRKLEEYHERLWWIRFLKYCQTGE